jgi:hypothetical protein
MRLNSGRLDRRLVLVHELNGAVDKELTRVIDIMEHLTQVHLISEVVGGRRIVERRLVRECKQVG